MTSSPPSSELPTAEAEHPVFDQALDLQKMDAFQETLDALEFVAEAFPPANHEPD